MISAVVVLYYPRLESLELLLRSVTGQVSMVFLVDNTPQPSPETEAIANDFNSNIYYIPMLRNIGIYAAQNIGIERSIAASCSHVLILDQDSVLSPNMVGSLLAGEAALLDQGQKVAAVGPQFIDIKTSRKSPALLHRYVGIRKLYLDPNSSIPVETDHLISSGAIIRTAVLQEIGLMREDLFIDWGDIEWNLRARSMAYKSYYIPCAVMSHDVGDLIVRILGRDVHVHTDLRNYYMLRNAIFLFRVRTMGWRWKINFVPKIPCYLILYPLLSRHRLMNVRLLLRAMRDGICGNMGKLENVSEPR
jgi:rhamnosyltransferase